MAPGGGSVSALVGSLGSALVSMVAALTFDKKGFEASKEEMEKAGNKAQLIKQKLSKLVDDDTDAFNQVIEATRLPESNKEEKRVKDIALLKANKNAINFPLEVSKLSLEINQYGIKKSMNVSVATGIVLWTISNQVNIKIIN